jgi:hypothetical protein
MNHIPSYIVYPNIRDVVAALDETIALNRWRILTGLRCTGKTRLLEEYVIREKLVLQPHEIVKVSIDEPENNSARGRRFSTPTAFMTFWEIDQELRKLEPRQLRKYQRVPPPENSSVYDNMFPSIFQNIRTMVGQRKPRLFIIDNAQYLDKRTLKRLMALYIHLRKESAVILCAQRASDEKPPEVLSSELCGTEMATIRDTLLVPCELKRITQKRFREEIMLQLLKPKNLCADFNETTAYRADAIYKDLWQQTGSNWARIDYMAQLLAMGLRQFSKQDERGVWMITEEVVDWVLRMLGGDVAAAQEDEKDDDEVGESVAEAA